MSEIISEGGDPTSPTSPASTGLAVFYRCDSGESITDLDTYIEISPSQLFHLIKACDEKIEVAVVLPPGGMLDYVALVAE